MNRWRAYLPVAVFAAILLAAWEAAVRAFDIPKYLLPSPVEVARAVYTSAHAIFVVHTPVTLVEAVLGLAMAVAAGVLVGASVHYFPWVRRACYPMLVLSQTVPSIVLAPLLVIWFGYGLLPKLLVVTIGCFFPIAVAVVDGLDGADVKKLKLLRSMGASRFQEFTLVKLPTAVSAFFTGLRVAATYAVMGAVIAEWMGSEAGLGMYIVRSARSFRTEQVFAGIAFVSIYSVAAFLLVGWARRRARPWERHVNERDNQSLV